MKHVRRFIKYKHQVMLILGVYIVFLQFDEQHNQVVIDNTFIHDYHASIFFFISLFFWLIVYYLMIQFSQYYQNSKVQLENDPLTDLKNRNFLKGADFRIQKDLKTKGFHCIGVIALDIDYFKQINDSLGHYIGDLVLIRIGEILKTNVRQYDECYRVGGDEFILIIRAHHYVELVDLVNRLQNCILKDAYMCDICLQSVTVSGGLIYLEPHEEIHNAMLRADDLLYVAKRSGRGQIHHDPINI
ncbi:GGDEF domain-containing protein [Vibrio sp. 99-70-13A1]|uniref:GGDEF domain-containing protein n=1 Tax=Vibrio sp. 99-70-13A1 TaxID=2607601 RepID=UPI0014934F81|nr:GGDEF domain-containing protein [Vibrio sp. 99-70-13A1]NOH97735.1 GGDEF domain-containing protein [Vibrio sp. 99-70-13A1]